MTLSPFSFLQRKVRGIKQADTLPHKCLRSNKMLLHILSIPELNLKEHSSDKVHPINGSKRKWLALLSTRWVTMEEYDFHEMTTKRKEPI